MLKSKDYCLIGWNAYYYRKDYGCEQIDIINNRIHSNKATNSDS